MFSQRGLLSLAHNQHELRELHRRVNAIRLNGIDSEFLTVPQLKEFCPVLDCSPTARYPVLGASLQRRGGTARHDAVAWGYRPGRRSRGVDIIQNCEVTGFRIGNGRVQGVETTRGYIGARRIGMVAAGHSGVLAGLAGFRLPVESHPLAGAGLRADQAGARHRGDVERGACLCQPVRQGRAGDGRRHRQL
jgi:sarcosine oxidase subunit beta